MKENKVLKFFAKTLNGMAYGLFATLIVGTIFSAIGMIFKSFNNDFGNFMYGIMILVFQQFLKYLLVLVLELVLHSL